MTPRRGPRLTTPADLPPATGPCIEVRNAAAGLDPNAWCGHGHVAFHISLMDRQDTRTEALLPRCVAAELLGTLLALINTHEGPAAAHQFVNSAEATAERMANLLERQQGQDRP